MKKLWILGALGLSMAAQAHDCVGVGSGAFGFGQYVESGFGLQP